MDSRANHPRGTVLRCPSCGQELVVAVPAIEASCSKLHPRKQMRPKESDSAPAR